MLWLAAHMWFLLFLSFAFGLGAGWWIWGARTDDTAPAKGDAPMGTLESDFTADPAQTAEKETPPA